MIWYLSHPEVIVDPCVPVPDWRLSEKGRDRIAGAVADGWPGRIARIVTSPERKARDTAGLFAAKCGVAPMVIDGMSEIDRSSTGYVPHARHEALADAFFERPAASADGWETAQAAQGRVAAAFDAAIVGESHILIVGHGGVGTLLWCHLSGAEISRQHDQVAGGGCFYRIDPVTLRPLETWRRIEDRGSLTLAG